MSENGDQLKAQYSENKKITDGNYDQSLAVKCVNGTFVGTKTENVIAYKGIPFVDKQPVGELRWKAPVDFTPDDGIYEAYHFARLAVQDLSITDHQGEDCLYLNVWQTDDPTAKKPVMVWIHGGAFMAGGTGIELFDCTNLAKEYPDVIFVTVAYRLGALGFLHLAHLADGKDYPDAQNVALLDQKMALKWVHENIAAFGTNSLEESIASTNDLMEALGCKTVADLMKVDARTLIDTAAEAIALRMFPVRDGRILPFDPWEAYASGVAKDITFLQGCNKDEMNCFVADWTVEGFKAWAADRKTKKFAQLLTDEERAKLEQYCKEGAVEEWDPDSRLFGHSWFIDGAIKMSECQTKGGGKSYTYYYRVESSDPIRKSAHFEEVPIVFCHRDMIEGRPYDETFCKTMSKMWVQFAKTGNPSLSADISPDGKAKEWPLYDLKDLYDLKEKQVMVLDEYDIHPAKESEVKIVDWDRTFFLTKYFML